MRAHTHTHLILVSGVLWRNSPLNEGRRVWSLRAAHTRPSSPKLLKCPFPFALGLFCGLPAPASEMTHSKDLRVRGCDCMCTCLVKHTALQSYLESVCASLQVHLPTSCERSGPYPSHTPSRYLLRPLTIFWQTRAQPHLTIIN